MDVYSVVIGRGIQTKGECVCMFIYLQCRNISLHELVVEFEFLKSQLCGILTNGTVMPQKSYLNFKIPKTEKSHIIQSICSRNSMWAHSEGRLPFSSMP